MYTQRRTRPKSETWLVASGNQALATGSQATGSLVALAAASITDAQTLTLSDGVNPAVVFEFNKSGGVTAPNVEINITAATTDVQVATAIVAAVNGATTLGVTASNVGGTSATVTLVGAYGTLSNVTNWASSNTTINSSIVQPVGGVDGIFGNGSSGLADGQLGVICWDETSHLPKGAFLTSTNNAAGSGANTVSGVNAIKIVQGTANSADFTDLNAISNGYLAPSYISSQIITSNQKIEFVGTAATTGRRSSFVVGDVVANTTSFLPADETVFTLSVSFHSERRNKVFGTRNTDIANMSIKTPVFANIGLTAKADKVDWMIQRLVYDAALKSKAVNLLSSPAVGNKPFIMFAIDIDGGGTGTTLGSITAGTPFNFVTKNGVTHSYTPDAEFVATIAEAIANTHLTTSSKIGVVNFATQAHDAILIVALDETINGVVTDKEMRQKVRLRLGMNDALYQNGRITYAIESSLYIDPQGKGRNLLIEYRNRPKKQVFTQQEYGLTLDFLQTPDYIVSTQNYNVFDIYSNRDMLLDEGRIEPRADVTRILVPSSSGTGDATTVSSLNAVLTPWLNSVGFEYKVTDASGTNLFV